MVEEEKEKEICPVRNVLVIGASAGGITAIQPVINDLSPKMDLAVVVVVHVSSKSNSTLIAKIFQRNTGLKCIEASDGMGIQKGHLYVAPPEHQLMFAGSQLKVSRGSNKTRYRPSIDVLFKSAAANFGYRTIGIILTGLFGDGTLGMEAIKSRGGICIIQDPGEAKFSDMPLNVLKKVKVDHQAPLKEISGILQEILNRPLPPENSIV